MPPPAPKSLLRVDGYVRDSLRLLERGDVAGAESSALSALALDPRHAPALLVHARVQRARGRFDQAEESLRVALADAADAAAIRQELAAVLDDQGRRQEAIALLQSPAPADADAWVTLGRLYDLEGDADRALAASQAALALSPGHDNAHFLAARSHTALGDIDAASELYRRLTRSPAHAAKAWFALLDLKTVRLDQQELARLQKLQTAPGLTHDDRVFAAFALGHALEQAQQAPGAFKAFEAANRLHRHKAPWNAAALSAQTGAIRRAFGTASASSPQQGEQAIFVLGMPRSGTTLIEQVLAAHPDVVGASELADLPQVIAAESQRRGRAFPAWVGEASEEDWLRLGAEYLARTRRHQTRRRFTDKYPENWPYIGAIARMLPGAKIVFCERDPLETLWSCYKQRFASGHFQWSYDFDSLARYAADCTRLWRHFETLEPGRCRNQSYEALVEHFETQTRALLDFVGLQFDPACLDFAGQRRESRTASAAQVRRPLQRAIVRGEMYGKLLDPLRHALERVRPAD